MKHILPVLTVTALAAAASAQTAPAPAAKQSLSYNRVVVSYVNRNDAGDHGISVLGQAKLGSGLYVAATTTDLKTDVNDSNAAVLGFAYSLPSVLGISTDLNLELGYKTAGVGLRALIGGGVELGVAYAHGAGSVGEDKMTVSASYNLGFMVKGLSLNASYASETGVGFDTTAVGIGYNF